MSEQKYPLRPGLDLERGNLPGLSFRGVNPFRPACGSWFNLPKKAAVREPFTGTGRRERHSDECRNPLRCRRAFQEFLVNMKGPGKSGSKAVAERPEVSDDTA